MTPPGIDAGPVDGWLADHVDGVEPPCTYELITGGHSNLTFKVTDATGQAVVLRRPPLGSILATAHDMGREHRVIEAVGRTAVPVPDALGLCEDEAVNGAPFYVMSYVEGVVLHDDEVAEVEYDDADARRALGFDTADVLAALHLADPDRIGLGDLGRREDYVGRQLRRWHRQWEASKQREIPDMDEAHALLIDRLPEQRYQTVVHGDYRLGNMLATPDGRIAAVLDWELCTLGDPLADLGYLLNTWAEEGEQAAEGVGRAPTMAGDFPTRAELVDRYADESGIDPGGIDYYRAFQYWRLGAIVEGVYARYVQGAMGETDTDLDEMAGRVPILAAKALELL